MASWRGKASGALAAENLQYLDGAAGAGKPSWRTSAAGTQEVVVELRAWAGEEVGSGERAPEQKANVYVEESVT